MLLRLSQLKDAGQLMDLDALIWDVHTAPAPVIWRTKELFLRSSPPGSQIVAVDEDERLCGYLGFRHPMGAESNRHVWEIAVAVHPSYQRQGIGHALMNSIKGVAREKGIRKLRLRVLSSNTAAISFYKRCGFVEEGRLVGEFYLEEQYVDDVLMAVHIR
ncbi:GNAT family N-acetyltransferase [Paenibacillus sp. JX-17]|uniref:GNAT family N-acetyltransferase n=1 Tax=Paenibacillus lacisoli TaxID=3064525 RepID=A0ABT9CCT7_9BACL|nr:GNAT family N-acetyltransferase [Paenibacillus sp. JX-17]MDO7906474.1 GNAT family N-acetyltransferase [Paenibacillus sp. JX-17]